MDRILSRTTLSVITILLASLAKNLQADWQVNNENSSIRYIYSLEGAAFRGRFREFSAEINLNPKKPEEGKILGIVNGFFETKYFMMNILEEDWFDQNNHRITIYL